MLTGGAYNTATDKTDITEVNDIVTSELKHDITSIRDVSELNTVIVLDEATELDDTMLDDLEFVKAHGYIQSEVCWICKDPFSSVPTIEPSHGCVNPKKRSAIPVIIMPGEEGCCMAKSGSCKYIGPMKVMSSASPLALAVSVP